MCIGPGEYLWGEWQHYDHMPHDFLNDCTTGSMWVSCSWFSISLDGGVCMFVMHKLYAYSNGFPHCGKNCTHNYCLWLFRGGS